jgi:hypothetical protein
MEAEEVSDTTGTILWSGQHGDEDKGVGAGAALGGDASDRSLTRTLGTDAEIAGEERS